MSFILLFGARVEEWNCSIVRKWASLNLIVQDSIFIFEREAEIRESRLGINGFFDRNSDLKSGYFR